MQFLVNYENHKRRVHFRFARKDDLPQLANWRASVADETNPQILDSIEFRKLATKRWNYYFKADEVAISIADIRRKIRSNPLAEVGFLLLVKPSWNEKKNVLGCCFARRTWCHHMVVDFIAVHPRVISPKGPRIRGVGTAIIFGLVEMAQKLGVPTIWGEATAQSAPFYQKVLNLPKVTDHFFIHGETMNYCCNQMAETEELKRTLK